jgi:hypothetical protein
MYDMHTQCNIDTTSTPPTTFLGRWLLLALLCAAYELRDIKKLAVQNWHTYGRLLASRATAQVRDGHFYVSSSVRFFIRCMRARAPAVGAFLPWSAHQYLDSAQQAK